MQAFRVYQRVACAVTEAAAAEGQLLNPPYIHHVAVPPSADRPAVRLAAAARGDGAIAIYDMDAQVVWQLRGLFYCNS